MTRFVRTSKGTGALKFHIYDRDNQEVLCHQKDDPHSHKTHGRAKVDFTGVENSQKPRDKFCSLCIDQYNRITNQEEVTA